MQICDYIHYDRYGEENFKIADMWTQDASGAWTPLCGTCLPEFWKNGDFQEDGPWIVYPIHVIPPGRLRVRNSTCGAVEHSHHDYSVKAAVSTLNRAAVIAGLGEIP